MALKTTELIFISFSMVNAGKTIFKVIDMLPKTYGKVSTPNFIGVAKYDTYITGTKWKNTSWLEESIMLVTV